MNETLELGPRLRGRDRHRGSTRSSSTALYPERFTAKEAEELRAHAGGSSAVRAALVGARARRASSAATCGGSGARRRRPCTTLPFLFEPEIGLDAYGTLAAKLGRDLG